MRGETSTGHYLMDGNLLEGRDDGIIVKVGDGVVDQVERVADRDADDDDPEDPLDDVTALDDVPEPVDRGLLKVP